LNASATSPPCARAWSAATRAGAAASSSAWRRRGRRSATRPFQLVTGRKWEGSAFGGARGRTDVPKIVDWYMEGKIQIDPLITHILKLEDINHGFELMERGESIRSVVVY
jgi:S-(hydroxymethyl)glutathione dehydrogenase/alcohol dehydrogenase